MSAFNPSRRQFLKTSAVVGGGLVVGVSLTGCSPSVLPISEMDGGFLANAFIQITPQNIIRFYCPRDEMGQGVTTGLGTLVAEELDVIPDDLDIVFAGVHSDYNNPLFGIQGTGGSTSLPAHYYPLRQAGANVRSLLLDAAAADLGVARDTLSTEDGFVISNGKRHAYSDFIVTAKTLTLPEEAPLKSREDFKYIGKETPRLGTIAKATGTAEYGIDVDIPGMHYAVVKRSPVAGGLLSSFDDSAVRQMPGVTDVVQITSGVAVVAEKYWQAKKAGEAIEAAWDNPRLGQISTAQMKADYEQAMADVEGNSATAEGDLALGFANVETEIESQFWAPLLAHAPMEPMNAVVRIENGEADVWSGTQGPIGAQGLVARFAGLDQDKVRVHSTYLGGGFGRRGTLSHVVEATEVAVATNKPIKLVWSREDDLKHGVYRPASLVKIHAGVDSEGKITGWETKRVGGNITPTTLANMLPGLLPGMPEAAVDWMAGVANKAFTDWTVDHSSIEGLFEDYDLANYDVRHVTIDHGVPLTFWRSVGHSYTAFAKESTIDELVVARGADPVQFRLDNTKNNPRLANVIRIAGERMKQMEVPAGHFLGFAAHGSFNTDVAEVAEVSIENNQIRVHRVTCVVDCGQVVNPDVVRAQMEGAIIYGLTAALHGNLELDNGAIRESNFHDYPMVRMDEAPAVDVVMVESTDDPTGVGEPGLPPIAPAVANAVFAATGQRLRSMPFKLA